MMRWHCIATTSRHLHPIRVRVRGDIAWWHAERTEAAAFFSEPHRHNGHFDDVLTTFQRHFNDILTTF